MICEIKTCDNDYAHIHCDDCETLLMGEGGGGYDGRAVSCYVDDSGANAQSCKSCDAMLCSKCRERANGICMLCVAEIAAENHRAVDAGKIYRDDRCACDRHARDPHCAKCGGLRRWIRAVA